MSVYAEECLSCMIIYVSLVVAKSIICLCNQFSTSRMRGLFTEIDAFEVEPCFFLKFERPRY